MEQLWHKAASWANAGSFLVPARWKLQVTGDVAAEAPEVSWMER